MLGREQVETPAGTFKCVAIEPILKAGGIFKNKGRLVIWLTDDERRMPVLMKSKVAIGSISVVLQEFQAGCLMGRYPRGRPLASRASAPSDGRATARSRRRVRAPARARGRGAA